MGSVGVFKSSVTSIKNSVCIDRPFFSGNFGSDFINTAIFIVILQMGQSQIRKNGQSNGLS